MSHLEGRIIILLDNINEKQHNSYLSANVSMYLHIPIHNVQSDLLDYVMNLFTQKDHKGE